ncbi:MAG TPA: OB-fold nucleic acid binding domain-containing protein, partial [Pyrinomonadaceae bacterium]|nr:OB-fold nucleic acid binding domain-containing protein [Pyrinomonadaceae bacterium]
MAQFSDYGFNRSHSVAYAYLAFQTAYLKAHYPEHFYAAVLSNEAQDAAKVFKYSKELRAQKVALLPPDVNESNSGFTPLSGAIRYGLTAIKGLGESSVKAICEARVAGPFRSFFDFAERVDSANLNKRVLESLIGAGAFDSLNDGRPVHAWRGGLHNSIDAAFARAEGAKRDRIRASTGLFGSMPEDVDYGRELSPTLKGWTSMEMLNAEKAALGFYITGHPLENYAETLQRLKAVTSQELPNLATGSRVTCGGIISDLNLRTTKKGDKFALLRLEDEAGGTKCVLWPEVYRKHAAVVRNELPAIITGRLELSEDNPPTIIVDQLQSIDASERQNEFMVLRPPREEDLSTLYDSILSVLSTNPGDCDVKIEAETDNGLVVRIQANNALRVKRSNELEEALKKIGCGISFEKEMRAH